MIAYLRATQTGFPEVRVVNCDDAMQFSSTTLVKAGETFVNFLDGGPERWGDYTGISRRHNSADARIWLAGCYGANISGSPNTWKTWISEVYAQGATGQAPVANFTANPTTGNAPLAVNFTDTSTNTPTSWAWTFTGANPSSSTAQNPSVTYNAPGTYSVTLTSTNAFGNDAETKTNYITVTEVGGSAPVANFTANPTTGNAPLAVNFTDTSTNTPTSWAWTFTGGNPSSSTSQNPAVTYNAPGTYSVTLTSTNAFGNDGETKTNYITVTDTGGSAPVANFVGNPTFGNAPMTVNFTDLSTNNPTSRSWSFPGGNPNTSSAANPSVTYSQAGLYTITLTVGNAFGSDNHTKTNYVQVNSGIGIEEADLLDGQSRLFPNPVLDLMHVLFTMESPEEVTIEVLDYQGRVVKLLYRDVPRSGENRLTFNKGALSAGTYFVRIRTNQSVLKNEKIIVAD